MITWYFATVWRAIGYGVLVVGLGLLSYVDLRTRRLPRELTYATAGVMVPLLGVDALVTHELHRLWTMALGATVALALMWSVYLVSRGQMGDGDVRLAPLLGAALAFVDPWLVLVGLFLGFAAGAAVAVLVVLCRHESNPSIPFGPFLALGAVTALIAGPGIAGW